MSIRIIEQDAPQLTLRQFAEGATDIDTGLKKELGRRVFYLHAEQLFGFAKVGDTSAERLRMLNGEMTVRYVGLRAIQAVRGSHRDTGALGIVEDEEVLVAVFDSNIVRGTAPTIAHDYDTVVAGLFPQVGVLLDEPVECRIYQAPRPTPPRRFIPKIV